MNDASPSAKPRTSLTRKLGAGAAALVSLLYLVNPTLSVFELLPDNLPVVGNLDEGFFTYVLRASLTVLGVAIPLMRRRTN